MLKVICVPSSNDPSASLGSESACKTHPSINIVSLAIFDPVFEEDNTILLALA
jgi:hypothetical protein